jgi:PIN domain nuclease of toxin-antitoxin system
VNLLLDTHILLWWLAGDSALPPAAADAIADSDTVVFVSAASVWEIAIKKATGRLDAPDDLLAAIEANNFDELPITAAHALAAGALPVHHADPFDRMLIAQARSKDLTLATVDARFSPYDVKLLPLAP